MTCMFKTYKYIFLHTNILMPLFLTVFPFWLWLEIPSRELLIIFVCVVLASRCIRPPRACMHGMWVINANKNVRHKKNMQKSFELISVSCNGFHYTEDGHDALDSISEF